MERKTGIILTLLMMASFLSMFNFHLVKATPAVTITIKANGEVDPDTAPIVPTGDVYTFIDNISYPTYYGILVNRSDIIIDGAGYVVEGNGTGKGFRLDNINNVTIKNTNLKSFEYGVHLESASGNTISGNNITDGLFGLGLFQSSYNNISRNNITGNSYGIGVYSFSDFNSISGNNIADNNDFGLGLFFSSYNTLYGNTLNNNKYNLHVGGDKLGHFMQSISVTNLVEGKPVYYFVNRTDLLVDLSTHPQVGFLGLINCDNARVEGLTLTGNRQGLLLAFTNNSRITDNTITNNNFGSWLFSSSFNSISGNNITNNHVGITLDESLHNSISGNRITTNVDGIVLDSSSGYNSISGNNITANGYDGISLYSSADYNSISGNNITGNSYGIGVYSFSDFNSISGNNITNNQVGIALDESSNNTFVYNNFIENTEQVEIVTSGYANFWDDDRARGNHWSNYAGDDADHDGIGDTPHIIDADNQDNYPLMEPYSPSTLTILSTPIAVTFTVNGTPGTTPWSGTYGEGLSISLVMPEIYTAGDARYYWNKWSDENPNRSRTITMNTDITLTAQYTGPYYQLTITSSPITGITFTINEVPQTTPYIEWMLEGSYTLEMPETHEGYDWSHWLEEGETNRIKLATLDKEITLTAVFADTTPPTISLLFPKNKTYTNSSVPLVFAVSESTSWIGYSLDNQINMTMPQNTTMYDSLSYSTTISDLPDGVHSITVYANDTAGNMGRSDTIYFTVQTSAIDTFPPDILILSPENKTYTTTHVSLTATADESVIWMAYSLDSQANATFNETITLSGLSNGSHSLIIYAEDAAGNIGASEIIYFRIEAPPSEPPPSEPLPIWIVAVIVIIAAFGTAVYLLKIKGKAKAPGKQS